MRKTAIIPEGMQEVYDSWQMSPAVEGGGLLFFTGFTGVGQDGAAPDEPEAQFRNIFDCILAVLDAAGLDFGAVVEMTSYHIGLQDHLELFRKVRADYVQEPFPAWTAIEVAGFVRPGPVCEIRVIAARPD